MSRLASMCPRAARTITLALALSAALAPAAVARISTGTAGARLVQRFEGATLGVTRPEGLAYARDRALFFVIEAGAQSTRIVTMTPLGEPVASAAVPVVLRDPMNVTFDDRGGRLLLMDDAAGELIAYDVGPDGSLDVDAARRFEAPRVGPMRAAGMTADPQTGTVFVLDRISRRVLAFAPDSLPVVGQPSTGRATATWIPLGELAELDLAGIAFDPLEEHLFVLDPEGRILYELAGNGALAGAYDLGSGGLRAPRGLVFAPSADATDDPEIEDLYVADARGASLEAPGAIRDLSLAREQPLTLSAVTSVATLVRTIDTSRLSPPSPDPSGLGYDARTGRLLMVDGEVEEMSIWHHMNYYELSLSGALLRGADLTNFTIEPVGLVVNPLTGRVFVSDDDARKVFDIDLGNDRLLGTSDDRVTSFPTKPFGSDDPEGVSFDPTRNRLYVADGVNAEIYVINPGPNGAFDGVSSSTDDVVTHFDTARLGVTDPECVEYNAERGTLFVIGSGNKEVVEMTLAGALIARTDVSFLPLQHAAGMTFAPGSVQPSQNHLYVCDRGSDNDNHPSENDGRIYEISLSGVVTVPPPPAAGALAFVVATGKDDAEESASGSVSTSGSDLELVDDGDLQTVGLRFAGVAVARGAVIDSAFLQFTSDEAQSEATALVIHGQAADNAASFSSSARGMSSRARTAASSNWTVVPWTTTSAAGPAQRSRNLKSIVQEIVNRPGWSSGNALALIVTGTGHRTAKSYEAGASSAPVLHLWLGSGAGTGTGGGTVNHAPVVDAGPAQTVTLPAAAALDGTAGDDGLPAPSALATVWTRASGPGVVTFANDRAVDTQASFAAAGHYVLRLTVTDGALSAADSVALDVRAASVAGIVVEKRVATINDDAEERSGGSTSLTSSDLELTLDGVEQKVGLRFAALGLPRGARIVNAWIQFRTDEATSDPTTLTIRAQAADAAPTFTSASGNVSARPLTASAVSWSPEPWLVKDEAGPRQRTPDLGAVLEELTARSGWSASSSVVIVVSGAGRRVAESFDGDHANAPLLHVEYR